MYYVYRVVKSFVFVGAKPPSPPPPIYAYAGADPGIFCGGGAHIL